MMISLGPWPTSTIANGDSPNAAPCPSARCAATRHLRWWCRKCSTLAIYVSPKMVASCLTSGRTLPDGCAYPLDKWASTRATPCVCALPKNSKHPSVHLGPNRNRGTAMAQAIASPTLLASMSRTYAMPRSPIITSPAVMRTRTRLGLPASPITASVLPKW